MLQHVNLAQALQLALKLHRTGGLDDAERFYAPSTVLHEGAFL